MGMMWMLSSIIAIVIVFAGGVLVGRMITLSNYPNKNALDEAISALMDIQNSSTDSFASGRAELALSEIQRSFRKELGI